MTVHVSFGSHTELWTTGPGQVGCERWIPDGSGNGPQYPLSAAAACQKQPGTSVCLPAQAQTGAVSIYKSAGCNDGDLIGYYRMTLTCKCCVEEGS